MLYGKHGANKSTKIKLSLEQAEALALQAVSYLLQNPGHVARFTSLTGLDIEDFREQLQNHAFLAAILDFLIEHQESLQDFASLSKTSFEEIEYARSLLQPNYERDTP